MRSSDEEASDSIRFSLLALEARERTFFAPRRNFRFMPNRKIPHEERRDR